MGTGAYYPRSYGSRINWGGLLTPAIKALLIANTAVFLVQTLLQLFSPEAHRYFLLRFGLVPYAVTHGLSMLGLPVWAVWQPFTYLFLHGGLWHLLLNMLVLWMFGADIERTWGRRRFLYYYFLTGVGAGVFNIVVKTATDFGGKAEALIPTVGASGAIYGILIAAAILFPDRQVWLIPFPVTLPMRAFVAVMGAIAFFGSLGSSGDNISHVTHLGGMAVGYFYLRRGTFLYRLRNRYSDWQRQRLHRRFEVYKRRHSEKPPSHPDDWIH
jgi:membrane associated rhomboid family serine protease